MRELKFRVYDTGLKKMIYFDLKSANDTVDCTIYEDVMQYTGLKDKDGNEIYEGDIISQNVYPFVDKGEPNYLGVVEWIFAGFQYILRCVNPNKRGISDGINEPLEEGEEFEIVGNIYENLEILNKKRRKHGKIRKT